MRNTCADKGPTRLISQHQLHKVPRQNPHMWLIVMCNLSYTLEEQLVGLFNSHESNSPDAQQRKEKAVMFLLRCSLTADR
jgi:hypothetical protein